MKTVIRNSYTPKIGDYCETIVVDKETENAYIFDCDGVFTSVPQPVDVEEILRQAAEYTDEKVAPLAEKLDTIEEGAQVNVIETIMKNGTPLTVTNKTVNVTVPTKTSDLTNDGSDGTDTYVESAAFGNYYTKDETDTQIGYETTARELADSGLQEQIDAIAASSDVVDIVGTYAALQAYDTSKLHDNDIIKVLTDETRDDATTYYRWDTDTSTWSYIGSEGPFYTKAESDATFVPQTRTVNNKALSADITLTASDVGALPDSTVIPTVNDATLTIQKNGTDVATFTANSNTNATANITVPTDTSDLTNGAGFITSADLPTKTSELQNDGSDGTSTYVEADEMPTNTSDFVNDGADGTSTYVEADELGAAAFSNDYTDLDNLPTIPTVNNATLTIQKNGTAIDTFTANASVDKTINVTVPTDTSDLTNNAGFVTASVNNLANYYTKTDTYTQQEVNGLINAITVPTKTSELVNDGSDGTSTYVEASDLTGYQEKLVAGTNIQIAADGKTISATDTTYSDFTGATAQDDGARGLVPAPVAGDEGKFLQGDGTWGTPAGAVYTAGNGIDIDANNEISVDTTVVATQTDLSSKQDTLTAGNAISIDGNNEISVDVDSALDVSSTNPVENSVVTAAINGKQDTLTAGSNITINNNTISATDTTYSDFTGATSSVAGSAGLVPAPTTSDPDKFLKGDGTWSAIPQGATTTYFYMKYNTYDKLYSDLACTTTVTGEDIMDAYESGTVIVAWVDQQGTSTQREDVITYMSGRTDLPSLSFSTENRLYTYTYSYSNYQSTAVSFSYQNIQPQLTAGSNITIDGNYTISATDTTYSDFTGATSSIAGAHGLVPAPTTSDTNKVLKGDGTWGEKSEKFVIMKYGEANAWAKFIAAYNENAIVYCRASSNSNPATGSQTRLAFMAYVSAETNPTSVEFQYVRSVVTKTSSQPVDQVFVYKLESTNGGTWSVQTRDMAPKLAAGTNASVSYSSGTYTVSATDTTYSDFTGATSGTAGAAGLVPAPAAGDDTKYLKGDGTWGTPADTGGALIGYLNMDHNNISTGASGVYKDTTYTISGLLTGADIDAALLDGKNVYFKFRDGDYYIKILCKVDTYLYTIAYGEKTNGVLSNTGGGSSWYIANAMDTLKSVNDATFTIQHNGTTIQTFTANQSTNATANIETIWADDAVPTSAIPPVTTGLIQDNAVTNAKMDWSTIPIETGRSELLTIQHDSYVDKAFTFTKTFTTPPVVSVTMRGDAAHVPSTGELLAVVTDHITTTGFTARIFNPYGSGDRQMYIDYIAVGI